MSAEIPAMHREAGERGAQAGDEQNGFELWKVSADLTGLPVELG